METSPNNTNQINGASTNDNPYAMIGGDLSNMNGQSVPAYQSGNSLASPVVSGVVNSATEERMPTRNELSAEQKE
jgi:hypothetical protein